MGRPLGIQIFTIQWDQKETLEQRQGQYRSKRVIVLKELTWGCIMKNEQAYARERSWEAHPRQRKEQVQRHSGLEGWLIIETG